MQKYLVYIVVSLIIGLMIGSGITFALAGTAAPQQTASPSVAPQQMALPSEVPIGALLPLSGALSTFGEKWKHSLELAEEDINAYVSRLGLDVKFKIYVEDTKTSPEGALAALQTLSAKGIKLVVGPAASSEVAAVKSHADANKIVIFSPSSTAPQLAIKDDYIFRAVTSDVYQGKALARLMWEKGVRKVVVMYRGDDWGVGLFDVIKARFEELGGQVEGVKYDPEAPELSTEVRRVSDYVKEFGADEETGVLFISFEDDGLNILSLAKEDPALTKVKWFGTDGIAYSTKIAKQVGDVVESLGVLATVYLPEESPKKEQFKERYKERFGVEPDPYTYNIYDAAWVLALAVLEAGKYDGEVAAKVLPEVASRYFGVSGWVLLDEAGDRVGERYVITTVVSENGEFVWKDVGVYISPLDKVELST